MLKAMLVCFAIVCQSTLASDCIDDDDNDKIDVCGKSIEYLKEPIHYFPSCKSPRDCAKAIIFAGTSIFFNAFSAYICLSESTEKCSSIGGVLWTSHGCLLICGILGRALWVNEKRKNHPELAAILENVFKKQALATQPINVIVEEHSPLLVGETKIIDPVEIILTISTPDNKPAPKDLAQRFRAATLAGYFLPEDTLNGMEALGFVGMWKNESIKDLVKLLCEEQFLQRAKVHRKKLVDFISQSSSSI